MNCSALSAHLIFGKRAASKCQKANILKYNINKALTNGRARFKYFPGATSKELLHYIDATLEESNFEVAVIHVGVNDLMNSNNSVDKLLKNIYSMAEKCKNNGVKKIFILSIVKNNRIPLRRKLISLLRN